ncbi:MAG: selenoneine biosynthesis selenosugar synthase SenB [Magnetovibrio sp.]|nr:selenoneine biosynthesis selenosugar synthase SenB [Magnetovibrio sp.]
MKISLITPAKKHSKNGNRTSALRWARFLRDAGHRVRIDVDYADQPADLMIAIHAWRSSTSILRYRERYPEGPLVVALGGTDVNTFLKTEPETTLKSMEMADALVCLHDLIAEELPVRLREKLHVVRQSALPLSAPRRPSARHFDVCVIGHLRDEKDPFRAALAARHMRASSRLRVIHLGKAHAPAWADEARAEMAANPRYHWKGEVPGWRVRREFGKTHLMVISSNQEGGANVVSEAVSAGVPVVASDIPGNVGLLGADYPGYYPVRDERALARVLERAETEPGFLKSLDRHCRSLKPGFTPAREAAGWMNVVSRIT